MSKQKRNQTKQKKDTMSTTETTTDATTEELGQLANTEEFKVDADEIVTNVARLPDGGLEVTTEKLTGAEPIDAAPAPVPVPTEAPAPAPVTTDVSPKAMAQQQAEGAMAIFIERIKKDGTYGEQMVVTALEAYLAVMNVNRPLDAATIVREQTRLYTMFKNIGRRTDDFRKAVVVARFFFREYKDGAFHDTRINRGHEALQLNSDDRRAFYTYLQLFKIIAAVNDLKDVKKSVDVSRSLTNPAIPAEVKERYVSLIN